MNSISNRVFLVVGAALSFAITVNSLGVPALASRDIERTSLKADRSSTLKTGKAGLVRTGILFEENLGQMDSSVRYISRSNGVMTFLSDDGISYYLNQSTDKSDERGEGKRSSGVSFSERGRTALASFGSRTIETVSPRSSLVKMGFQNANTSPEISGEGLLEGRINYLLGNDPSGWVTDIPTFKAVRYRDLYDGIDLRYYGNDKGQMEYDFEVAPNAEISQIGLMFSGASSLSIDPEKGDLIIGTGNGELRHHRPIAFQYTDQGKVNVTADFETLSDGNVTFRVGEHDKSKPLIIDPIIGYSTYLGGSGDVDFANALAIDASGAAYLAGSTNSANFPTLSPYDGTFGGDQVKYDAFVTKMNSSGSGLVYSTYLGGSNDDNGVGITVDTSGQVYVSGFTDSTNFPTASPFQAVLNGTAYDGFVTKLNASGSGLLYSTYIGGSQNDSALAVSVDGSGFAHIAGETASTNFPTLSAYQNSFGGGASDAFVAKFNQTGNGLVFSTYLGGSSDDLALGLALNANGVYLAGATTSTNFPILNAIQSTFGGNGFFDGFVTKMNTAGSGLVFSTYLGGNDFDGARGIGLDVNGHACITGITASSNFPVLSAFQSVRSGTSDDAFVTRISSGGALMYSTYLGGSGAEQGSAIAVDATGAAYVTGSTRSTNFPTVDPVQASRAGESDAFVTKVLPTGSSVEFSTYIGGSSFDEGVAIAVDAAQNAYVAGGTDSSNFPTVSPFQANRSGASDGFLLRISSSVSTISGQVLTSSGQALRNAIVTLTDQFGVRRQSPSNSLGFYSFENVLPGQPYTLTVASRRYRFDPLNVTPNQSLVTINFTGLE